MPPFALYRLRMSSKRSPLYQMELHPLTVRTVGLMLCIMNKAKLLVEVYSSLPDTVLKLPLDSNIPSNSNPLYLTSTGPGVNTLLFNMSLQSKKKRRSKCKL